MLKQWRASLLLLLALPSAAFAQVSACEVFLMGGSNAPGEKERCMAMMERSEQKRRELQMLQGLSAHPYGKQQEQQRIYQVNPEYRQLHDQDMILNHGAGGCTPNFATGGCL